MNKQAPEQDDDYSNDGSDGFEKEDADDDQRLEQIKKAMVKENAKAAKVVVNPAPKRGLSGVKQGPIKPGDRKPSQSIIQRMNDNDDDEIIDVSSQKPSYL